MRNDELPVGTIIETAEYLPKLPKGWLHLEGQILKQKGYPELAAVLGRRYSKATDVLESFRLPNATDSRRIYIIKAKEVINDKD